MLAIKWPDFTVDQRAWELAKVALGVDASTSKLARHAQKSKDDMRIAVMSRATPTSSGRRATLAPLTRNLPRNFA